jgi:predicted nucleotidyltransferase
MAPATDALIQGMINVIIQAVQPCQIILFGSYAKGKVRSESDIDFLVVEDEPFSRGRSRRKEMAKLWRLLAPFKFPMDILVYSKDEVEHWRNTRNHVIAHALREGRLLYERP